MKEFDTLAELQGSTQSKTGLRLKCRENLYEYIVQASGYTATGDDVTFANGRVAKCVFVADAKYIKTTAGNVQDALDSIVSGGLPSQSGNEFKFLTTNGTSASWFQGTLQMDTFANLQTLSPAVDGTTFICQERANARYILQTSGYVALPGDVTFANGRVGKLQIDGFANIRWFGFHPANTATDNWPLFQDAIDRIAANGGGELLIPHQGSGYDGYYYGKAPRIVEPNIHIRCESPDTKLICTGAPGDGTGSWPNFGSVILGSILQPQNIPYYDISDISQGEDTITFTTASESSDFSEGDVIFICSVLEYKVGNPRRTYGQMNVVTSSSSGVVGLRYPIQESITGCQVQNYTANTYQWTLTNGSDPEPTKTEYSKAARDCSIRGGTWIAEKPEAPFNGGSGAIDCVIDVHRTEARSGVAYGNQFGHCEFKAVTQISRKSGIEIAYCGHNNKVEITTDVCKAQGGTSYTAIGAIWCNEGSRNNTINVGTLDTGEVAHESAIAMANTYNNVITVGSILSSALTNAVVRFRDSNIATNRAVTEDNIVKVGNSTHSGTIVNYVEFTNNGKLSGNSIIGGNFSGAVTNAVAFDGITGIESVSGCRFADGSIKILNYADVIPVVKDCHIAEGLYDELSVISDSNRVQASGITSDLRNSLTRANVDRIGGNATNASPYVLTSTIPAGALQYGDTVDFYMSVFISGGASTDTKAFNFSIGGVSDSTFNTTASGSEVIIRGQLYKASDTAIVVSYTIAEGDATRSTRCQSQTVPNITSNDTDFVLTVTPSNAGDTLNIRAANVSTYCRNVGW